MGIMVEISNATSAGVARGDPLWQGVAQGRVRYERFWALPATVGGEAVLGVTVRRFGDHTGPRIEDERCAIGPRPVGGKERIKRLPCHALDRDFRQSSRIPPSCAREETPESRGMPCLFLNTERGFGGKPPQKSGFRRHLAGSKMPKEGSKMPKETFFTAISRWRVVSRRALDASGFWQGWPQSAGRARQRPRRCSVISGDPDPREIRFCKIG